MKQGIVLLLLFSLGLGACVSSKSATDKRIKKQEKHRKRHPCPQIDC